MRSIFLKLSAFAFALPCLLLGVVSSQAADLSYTNTGSINGIPPNIDATNFYNSGTWNIATTAPYKTAHTYNYTNTGTMTGAVGWEFDYGPSTTGTRSWSANFLNDNGGTIYGSTYLWISATNILNKGALQVGPSGEMKLIGSQINLARSQLQIAPIAGSSSTVGTTNFVSDTSIYDQYWNQTNLNFNSFSVYSSLTNISTNLVSQIEIVTTNVTTNVSSAFFGVTEPCNTFVSGQSIGFADPFFAAYTNISSGFMHIGVTNTVGPDSNDTVAIEFDLPTNIIRQAVFVKVGNAGIIPAVRFTPSLIPTNYFQTVGVQLAMPYTNLATLVKATNIIYFQDSLASSTNRGLLVNNLLNPYAVCATKSYRPVNYLVQRTTPAGPALIYSNNPPSIGFFRTPSQYRVISDDITNSIAATFTNFFVSSDFAGYSFLIDNIATPTLANSVLTNQPGRMRIIADNLDLTRARLRAEGDVWIQATNLIGSTNASVDCENLSYDLGANSGFLNFTNLAGVSVSRLKGTVSAWSATWNNPATAVIQYYGYDTNIMALTNAYITNSITYNYSVLILDASQLASDIPVTVQNLILHGTNILVSDAMTVSDKLLFDTPNVTLLKNLTLTSLVQNWDATTGPKLLNFTNNGILIVPNNVHLGDDLSGGYRSFVNRGTIYSASQAIKSDYWEATGGYHEVFSGGFSAWVGNALLSAATVYAPSEVNFYASNLTVQAASLIESGGTLNFTVTNILTDGGLNSGNQFMSYNGFNLLTKPASGDLSGTLFTSYALNGSEVMHTWAGTDYGTNYVGYTNNSAIGALKLVPQGPFPPLFHFTGAGSSNALYVGYLDLSQITSDDDLNDMLQIDSNITLYYANAALGYVPPSGTAAQYLDGKFGGHLRWIKGYASQAVSMSVTNNGSSFQLSLTGFPDQPYIIQSSTNLVNWTSVATNSAPPSPIIFTDTNNYPYNFYRVIIP